MEKSDKLISWQDNASDSHGLETVAGMVSGSWLEERGFFGKDDGISSKHCLCGYIEVFEHSEVYVDFTKGKA